MRISNTKKVANFIEQTVSATSNYSKMVRAESHHNKYQRDAGL